MRKMTTTGIENLLSTTDRESHPPMVSREIREEYGRMQRRISRLKASLPFQTGKMKRHILDEIEAISANIRAFERINGLTPTEPRLY